LDHHAAAAPFAAAAFILVGWICGPQRRNRVVGRLVIPKDTGTAPVFGQLAHENVYVGRPSILARDMDIRIFLFLIAATSLETFGDAIVRMGIGQTAWLPRTALFLAGAVLLFGYGLSLNLAPIEFGRVVGLYIATLFIMWQLVNLIVFRSLPGMPVLFGGLLIVVGGLIVTFWE
jgi:hypothetical protein